MKIKDVESDNSITFEEAFENIKNNSLSGYRWYLVKNKKDSYIDLGGRNKEGLEFKAYLPLFINGEIKDYGNNMVRCDYSFDSKGYIEYPTWRTDHNMSQQELLDFLKNTDFKTYKPEIIREEVEVVSYKTIRTFKKPI